MNINDRNNSIAFCARNVIFEESLAKCGEKVYKEALRLKPELEKKGDDLLDLFVSAHPAPHIAVIARDVDEALLKVEKQANPKTIFGKIYKSIAQFSSPYYGDTTRNNPALTHLPIAGSFSYMNGTTDILKLADDATQKLEEKRIEAIIATVIKAGNK